MLKKAFSLVELMVVMAVITMLLSILLPGLQRARQECKRITCLTNLRQMVIAANVYVQNNDGYYPIAYYYEISGQKFTSYCWDFTSIKDWDTLEQKVIPGLLWEGQTIEKIQQCPSFNGASNWLDDPYSGYNYNVSYIGHGSAEAFAKPVKAMEVKHPSKCALFGDGQWSGGANKFMRSPFLWGKDTFPARSAGTQGFRHLGKTNVVYCDGSACSSARCYTQTEASEVPNIAPGTGFLSPDNSAYDLE
jgi:prepilin-type N-terminal cleavage/methylation domain-containing protein/prepilin-type processing-associated H-X9-DG protein